MTHVQIPKSLKFKHMKRLAVLVVLLTTVGATAQKHHGSRMGKRSKS